MNKSGSVLDARSLSQNGKAKHSNRYCFSGKIKYGAAKAVILQDKKTAERQPV